MTRYSESWATARNQSRRLYTSWRRDRLLSLAERNETFLLPFIEKLQQASSDDRIFHNFANMLCLRRANNSSPPRTCRAGGAITLLPARISLLPAREADEDQQ
jgi:hypothetical protein